MKLNMWRPKVEWDANSKVYTYRGHDIIPLSWEDRRRQPLEMQDEYYWGEIDRIDHMLDDPPLKATEDAQIGLDLFFKYFEEDNE